MVKRIFAVILVLAIVFTAFAGFKSLAYADTNGQAKATIEIEGDAVKQDSEFNVNIVYSGVELGRVKGTLKFDPKYFEFIDGQVDDSGNNLAYFTATGDMDGKISVPMKFKALLGGTGKMTLETTMAITMDEESTSVGQTSKDITIDGENQHKVETKGVDEPKEDEKVISEETEEVPEVTGHPYLIYILGIAGALLLLLVIVLISRRK